MSVKLWDTEEDISRCLACPFVECTNCLSGGSSYRGEKNRRPVQQIDPTTGAVIATFGTITAAARAVGISTTTIRRTITRGTASNGGYLWKEV